MYYLTQNSWFQEDSSALQAVVAARRQQMGVRIGFCLAVALIFQSLTGFATALTWAAAYTSLQIAETLLFRRIDVTSNFSGSQRAAFLAMVVLGGLVFCLFGVFQALHAEVWGLLCATLLWSGTILNGAMVSGESKSALAASIGPPTLAFLVSPFFVFAFGGTLGTCITIIAAGALNGTAAIALWSTTRRLHAVAGKERETARLAILERRWDLALEAAGQGIWDIDLVTGEAHYSRAWRTMRGFGIGEEINGDSETWLERVHADDREKVRRIAEEHTSGVTISQAFEYRERRRDGEWIWILSRGKVVERSKSGQPTRVAGTDTDITKLKEEEARQAAEAAETFRLNYERLHKAQKSAEEAQEAALMLARHDALTGLPNRRVLAEALHEATERASKESTGFAVMVVDLDHFKPINDIEGHEVGDAVLCEIAQRLEQIVGTGDTVARMGGDEFAIVAQLTSDQPIGDAAALLADNIINAVERPIIVQGRSHKTGASIGIAFSPEHGLQPERLLRAADIAMYRAKQQARGAWRFFEDDMESELRDRADLEEAVRQAVADDAIEPHYQPLINFSDNRLVGFEVLARWKDSRGRPSLLTRSFRSSNAWG